MLKKIAAVGCSFVALLAFAGCDQADSVNNEASGQTGVTASANPSQSPVTQTPTPTPSEPATQTPTPSAPAPIASLGGTGDVVRELEVRLRQLDWLSGDITGTYSNTIAEAVKGFQAKRNLPATGIVDQATWDVLVKMTQTPTHDEMYNILRPGKTLYGPGSKGDKVKDIQARLKQIGWFFDKVTGNYGSQTVEAVKGFQAKRGIPVTGEVDQRTLDRLKAMTRAPEDWELNNQPKPKPVINAQGFDSRCMTPGRVLCASKADRKLTFLIDGVPQMQFEARFGGRSTPTREGVFKVERKYKHAVSNITGTEMPFSMFFSRGQAVHYSADFARRGWNGASIGCINIRDYNGLAQVFSMIQIGDKVVVY